MPIGHEVRRHWASAIRGRCRNVEASFQFAEQLQPASREIAGHDAERVICLIAAASISLRIRQIGEQVRERATTARR